MVATYGGKFGIGHNAILQRIGILLSLGPQIRMMGTLEVAVLHSSLFRRATNPHTQVKN